jgi:hypothetical protein
LVANAIVGFFQERRAWAAVQALRSKLEVTGAGPARRELDGVAGARDRHRRRGARARG